MPGHLLDGLSIGEAGRVRGKAELALESLLGMFLLDVPHSLSLHHLIVQLENLAILSHCFLSC